ncbi:hypothetical protein [Zooshikella ganghwensis]|uniref:Uncharacterized protein n=1 Tax=Zooshikella ganghwensis TaxID=202772 RepID=A0A4V1INE6_9GAMM|nr:hypothetical protein [Zooshikella ganghwensis]RDH43461.1 hypothetical protein B9G39_08430 [Zooshikella ganghwensis]
MIIVKKVKALIRNPLFIIAVLLFVFIKWADKGLAARYSVVISPNQVYRIESYTPWLLFGDSRDYTYVKLYNDLTGEYIADSNIMDSYQGVREWDKNYISSKYLEYSIFNLECYRMKLLTPDANCFITNYKYSYFFDTLDFRGDSADEILLKHEYRKAEDESE